MTSELNDKRTREFFRENKFFGLNPDTVHFFTQGTMPAISYRGELLMDAPDSLALSPNGHGGTLLALKKSGALEEMKRNGVEYISYFQWTNPLVPMGTAVSRTARAGEIRNQQPDASENQSV